MPDVTLELTAKEFIIIMSALEYCRDQYEIRTLYTGFRKNSDLTEAAEGVYEDLLTSEFRGMLWKHLEEYRKENGFD